MIKKLLLLALLAGCFMFTMPVQAKDLFDSDVCKGGDTSKSAVCTDNKTVKADQDPFSGPNGLLYKLTNIVAFVGGAAAIIMIMISGMRYITSGSDLSTNSRTDSDVEDAKHTLNNAVIGLVVIILARQIILFVLNRL